MGVQVAIFMLGGLVTLLIELATIGMYLIVQDINGDN